MRFFRRSAAMLNLIAYFHWELLLANLEVAKHVLRPAGKLKPRVIRITVKEPTQGQVALLSALITLTPGTLTLEALPEPGGGDDWSLYIHAMDVTDVEKFRHGIEQGLERRVREVFQ